jgi:hypothetical protein
MKEGVMKMLCMLGLHQWQETCTCMRCNAKRDEGHKWDGCVCVRCGADRHIWVKLSENTREDRETQGKWCEADLSVVITTTITTVLECKECKKRREEVQSYVEENEVW